MSLLHGFSTVNRDSAAGQAPAGGPEATIEAREARCIADYERALALLARRDDSAQEALRTLLAEPVVAECATDQLHRIKFLALKNLGDLLARQPGGVPDALSAYCLATEVDSSDALLWNKLGTLAAEAGYWAAARTAFERGLELDPQHPTMPDKLLSLLQHTGDASAAATLAAALLRQQPRHAGAAAVLALQRRGGRPSVAGGAALLQLPSADTVPGAAPRLPARHHDRERPRTLEQPTWQQLLHHSLLFLSSNRLADGNHEHGGSLAHAAAGAAGAPAQAAAGSSWAAERKGGPMLVRFNYKRLPVPPSQKPMAAAVSAAATAALTQIAQQAGAVLSDPALAAVPATGAAGFEAVEQGLEQAAAGAVREPCPAAAADVDASLTTAAGGPAAAGQEQSPAAATAAGPEQSPAVALAELSPRLTGAASATPAPEVPISTPCAGSADAGDGVAPGRATVAQQCSPADAPTGDEEQEQRHPNGRHSSKPEARATRSRAATGRAGLPLVPASPNGDQPQGPEEEALDLLGTLGSLLSAARPPASDACVAASPLLSSPAKAGNGLAFGGGAGEQQLAQQQKEEEDAVRAFIRKLPAHGVGQRELALLLLQTLGTASSAARLAPPVRQQLLQVAHHAQHDIVPLVPELCLVLGELFADALAIAARKPSAQQGGETALGRTGGGMQGGAAAQANRCSTPTASASWGTSGTAKRSAIVRGKRSELTFTMMQQSARLWLSRYRLSAAEAQPAITTGEALERLSGMARHWWAMGRLLESGGDMPAASVAYKHCQDTLMPLGVRTVFLPHCQADTRISVAAVHAKQEALEMHTVLESANQSYSDGDHAGVVAALAPMLLSCTGKEQQVLQLDQQQWLSGMQMLLAAAGASSDWGLALRCHLRLLNVVLLAPPVQLLAVVQGKDEAAEGPAAAEAASVLCFAADQFVAPSSAAGTLDAAASFLQQHRAALVFALPGTAISSSSSSNQPPGEQQVLTLHPMERAMFEEVEQQLALAVASCGASLTAAGPQAGESILSLKINAKRTAMSDAATALLLLDSLASGNMQPTSTLKAVTRARDVAWHLCDALGNVQALTARRGRFVQACLSELQSQLLRVEALGVASAAAAGRTSPTHTSAAAGDADAPDVDELHTTLTGGCQHCLHWLFGLELPGLDKHEEWGGNFQAKGSGDVSARQLSSQQAVATVWPLVEPYLLKDAEHVVKYKGFLTAAAVHFRKLPVTLAVGSSQAWRQLAAAEPPHLPSEKLDRLGSQTPMQRLLQLAVTAPAEPMAVDGDGPTASAGQEQGEEGDARNQCVRRSLYYLLSALQDAEGSSIESLLDAEADALLEGQLQAVKADLACNPGRSSSWERLADDYHGAADGLLDEACKAMPYRQWKHDRDLQSRVRHWRRLAYWAAAGAWLCASSDDMRTRLLTGSGSRLLEGVLRTLPVHDPLGSSTAWQEVKDSSDYKSSCRLAAEAFDVAEAMMEAQDREDWGIVMDRARCLRKLQQPAVNWLPMMARACHFASSSDGGVLLPLYALHASRMRLLLAMPSAARWGGGGGVLVPAGRSSQRGRGSERRLPGSEEERMLLEVVGSYCFLPTSNTSLKSPSHPRRSPAAADAEAERRADWRGLLEDCRAAMRWCLEKDKGFHRAAYRLAESLQRTGKPHQAAAVLAPFFSRAKQVFVTVMGPIKEAKVEAGGKRGRGRKPQDSHGTQELEEDDGEPVPDCNWGEPPAWLSSVGLEEDEAIFGTRLRKTLRLYFSCLADSAAATASGQGPELQAARLHPLEVLQQAAAYISSLPPSVSKAWEGLDKLARGHFMIALVACLSSLEHPELLQQQPAPSPAPSAAAQGGVQGGPQDPSAMELDGLDREQPQHPVGQQTPVGALAAAAAASGGAPLSATPAWAAHATPADAAAVGGVRGFLQPTPGTQARQQQSLRMLQAAARLSGSRAEPMLAKAHQVFSDYSIHNDGDDKWKSIAVPSVLEALSSSSGIMPGAELLRDLKQAPPGGTPSGRSPQADLLYRLFKLYAGLYVRLLQYQGAAEKLLSLLLAMKKRMRGLNAAEPRHARFLRRQAQELSEALLGALEVGLAAAEQDAATLATAPAAAAAQESGSVVDTKEGALGAAGGNCSGQQQEQGSPPPPTQGREEASETCSPARPGSAEQRQPVAQTPAAAAAGGMQRGVTPGTDVRALLGSPGTVPSSEQQQLQDRSLALLQVAHLFNKDVARWLQMLGAASSSSSSSAREDVRALGIMGEEVVLRAYRLHVRCLGYPLAMAELSKKSRTEQVKACEEVLKQSRRQSKQQGRQQQLQAGTAAGPSLGLAPVPEEGEEAGARKRGAAGASEAAPQSTRKRARSGSAPSQLQEQQQQQEPAEALEATAVLLGAVAAAEQSAEYLPSSRKQ